MYFARTSGANHPVTVGRENEIGTNLFKTKKMLAKRLFRRTQIN